MFITKLYRNSKPMFFVFVLGIGLYFLINYKWGVVATPVLQFGMFSQVFHIKDTQTIYLVEANGKMINNANISFTNRDIVQLYIDRYKKHKAINGSAYNTMAKYVHYSGLFSFMDYDKYSSAVTDTMFTSWYKTKIQYIIREPVQSLFVYEQQYVWKDAVLAPVNTPHKLTCIVP